MVQPERGQVREQLAAQVVDHPLAGIDLHLRAVGRHQLVDHLQHDAGDDDEDQQPETVIAARPPGSTAIAHPGNALPPST